MTESTTIEAPPPRLTSSRVIVEDDATPVARLIGRTLCDAAAAGDDGRLALAGLLGTVAVRSHDTPQTATVTFTGHAVEVTSGVLAETDATVVVDLDARFAATEEPIGDAELATAMLSALRPPLPHWRDAAARFWKVTRDISGIPDVLVVEATGPDGSEHDRFGDGTTTYGICRPRRPARRRLQRRRRLPRLPGCRRADPGHPLAAVGHDRRLLEGPLRCLRPP